MDNETITLPRHLEIFLRLLKPFRSKFYLQMGQKIAPSVKPINLVVRLSHLLAALNIFASDANHTLNYNLGAIVQRSDATEDEIADALREFERELDDFLVAYHCLQALRVSGNGARAVALLTGAYRQVLGQIKRWLDELAEALEDPLTAIKKRGLPVTGHVQIPFTLTLTTGSELEELADWLDTLPPASKPAPLSPPAKTKKSGFSLLSLLAGLWLGSELSEHFGGDGD